jgi:hypothetical protein
VLAYSTIGLTIAVYAADFTGFVQSLRFRRINPSVLFPLPTMLSICLSQDKLMLMVTVTIYLFLPKIISPQIKYSKKYYLALINIIPL